MELLSLPSGQEVPRLDVSEPLSEIERAAEGAASLVLVFGAFRDGRGFSVAAALRARGYAGRLIAAGAVLPDQIRHLHRSGFDAVEIGDGDVEVWRRSAAVISQTYPRQSARDRPRVAAAPPGLSGVADLLNARYVDAEPATIIRAALAPVWGLRPAVLSSFGAEAAVLLDIVAEVDPEIPVLFLDTGQHFLQTLSYRETLSQRLGLTDVRIIRPDPVQAEAEDPSNDLWKTDPDACCDLRKIRPLRRAAGGFNLLITGRKRHHEGLRGDLPIAEVLDGSLRLNPLTAMGPDRMRARFDARGLPEHPLVEQGYPSIGCWPCTRPADSEGGVRSGRWAGTAKTECGIHLIASSAVREKNYQREVQSIEM